MIFVARRSLRLSERQAQAFLSVRLNAPNVAVTGVATLGGDGPPVVRSAAQLLHGLHGRLDHAG